MQPGDRWPAQGDIAAVVGAQKPRIMVTPKGGKDHPRWKDVLAFVDMLGVQLDPWQLLVLRESLKRKGKRWAAFSVGLCCPRQNGKNGVLEIRELIGPALLDERLLIHTAHLADTSLEGFRRLDDLIEDTPKLKKMVKHVWRGVGKEVIEFRNGNRIRFRTRTGRGGRGFSGSPVVFDEAMDVAETSMASILPVISAQPDPQVIYTGSAVDQMTMQDGNVFARVRRRALEGDDPRLAYFEWSVDAKNPDELDEAVAASPEAWALANPALGIRIDPSYIEAEYRELDMRSFAVERLGVGDWPAGLGKQTVISLEKWNDLIDQGSKITGPICFSLDVSPDRGSTTISAAGLRSDGLLHVETVEKRRGTAWVLERLLELRARHGAITVACDTFGPGGSLLREFEDAGLNPTPVSAREMAYACGVFFDVVEERRLRHLGTPEMVAALKGAQKRSLGDAWAWDRKTSAVDITPLVAATLAVWVASEQPAEVFASAW